MNLSVPRKVRNFLTSSANICSSRTLSTEFIYHCQWSATDRNQCVWQFYGKANDGRKQSFPICCRCLCFVFNEKKEGNPSQTIPSSSSSRLPSETHFDRCYCCNTDSPKTRPIQSNSVGLEWHNTVVDVTIYHISYLLLMFSSSLPYNMS
jgi:hypothetical protein